MPTFKFSTLFQSGSLLSWVFAEVHTWFNNACVVIPEFLSSIDDKMLEGKWSCQFETVK